MANIKYDTRVYVIYKSGSSIYELEQLLNEFEKLLLEKQESPFSNEYLDEFRIIDNWKDALKNAHLDEMYKK